MLTYPDSQFPNKATSQSRHHIRHTQTQIAFTHPNPISTQLQISQLSQPFQALDPRDLILHEINICQFNQMRHVLDMLDLIKTQVQAG